ncbi:RING-H2 finger protein ATL65-like [Bidens hawaiensis]|uniref:RING-H2 finger protein ATL65-like n=1 Tax=Bidens hawaiensis TaxID=980011 RepID=UPI00404A6B9A
MATSSPSPSPSPDNNNTLHQKLTTSPSKPPVRFTPPLIAMVIIIATAFILIAYSRTLSRRFLLLRRRYRQWHRRRRLLHSYVPSSNGGDIESVDDTYNNNNNNTPYGYNNQFSPYGLDESVIKTIPLSIHTRKSSVHECAVCLLEFEDDDYVRTLPVCYHAFHVDCIDVWLRCHANCPLCRASVFRSESPFSPMMSARIRPNFDADIIGPVPDPEPEPDVHRPVPVQDPVNEITSVPVLVPLSLPVPVPVSPMRNLDHQLNLSDERLNRRDFLLKRSYSFGFERNLGSERLVMEPATSSPWRCRRTGGSFWSKRPSPFSSLSKSRVFSFRYYRGMKSPFFRRRGGFIDSTESTSSRRKKSFASPIFMRQSGMFSSSRLRSGDPEALLSPERYNRR